MTESKTKTRKRHASESRLMMYRNFSLGTAAVAFTIVLLIAKLEDRTPEAHYSLLFAVISLPLSLASAAIPEHYILEGKRSYVHFERFGFNFLCALQIPSGLCFAISFGSLLAWFNDLYLWVYIGTAVVALLLTTIFLQYADKDF